ncbi:MAG: DUF695 domain-containing protein [Archangium sp.]|nr:DUF695 domain-containing protein [Archangium sp.]
MGVHGAVCQLCGLPTQHDHYVPTASGMLKIYRGSAEHGGHTWEADERPFVFGPSHAWLSDAIGLSREPECRLFRGTVEDGGLQDTASGENLFVWDGDDEALVYHHRCWELMGSPTTLDGALRGHGTPEWSLVALYHEQLFEFWELADDGKAWMLEDPSTNERSKARLTSLIDRLRSIGPHERDPESLAEIVAMDRDWYAVAARNDDRSRRHVVHYRTAPRRDTDRSAYPHLVCVLKAYAGDGLATGERFSQLEAFFMAMKAAVERDGLGVMVLAAIGEGQAQYLAYVRDVTEAHARIDAVPGINVPAPAEYDDEDDPSWRVLFEEMGLPRR